MIWLPITLAAFGYIIIIAFLNSIISARSARIIISVIAVCLPAWNILPVWAIHTYQCKMNGGIEILEPFNGDAIKIHGSYSLKPLEKYSIGPDREVRCDDKCKKRLVGYFSGGIGELVAKNGIAIETSNIKERNVTEYNDYIHNRFWLADYDNEYCVAYFDENKNMRRKNSGKDFYLKNKCVAAMYLDNFSTNYELIEKPIRKCPNKKDKYGKYTDYRKCRYTDQVDIFPGVIGYTTSITKKDKSVAVVNTYKSKATTFIYVPIKLGHCEFHESSYDYKELLVKKFIGNK